MGVKKFNIYDTDSSDLAVNYSGSEIEYSYGDMNERVQIAEVRPIQSETAQVSVSETNGVRIDVVKTPGALNIISEEGSNIYNGSNNAEIDLTKANVRWNLKFKPHGYVAVNIDGSVKRVATYEGGNKKYIIF